MKTDRSHARVWMLPLLATVPALVLAAPLQVSGQTVATSFEELRRLVRPGETIYVTDVGGVTIKGTLAGLSDSSLELRVQRGPLAPPLALPERDVNHIVRERSDSLWNGTLIGLAVGAVSGALIALAGRTEYEPYDASSALGLGGIGLITGLLIDVFNKERATIYVHAPAPRVSPLLSKSGAGVQVRVRF